MKVEKLTGGFCGLQAGCFILVLVFNILIGGWSIDYLIRFFELNDIPFWVDALIGLFVAEVSVPLAVVLWLLTHFGAF